MGVMLPDTPPHARIRHVTSAGTTLALSLAPVVIGVLLAKSMAMDPMSPVSALVTRGGQGVPLSPAQLRGCGRQALRDWRTPLTGTSGRWCSAARRPLRRRPASAGR